MKVVSRILVLSLVAVPAAALAQTRSDVLGSAAIAAGDYTGAERRLVSERRIYRDRPEILLNLAAVYARTQREADARALYETVLNERPVLMDIRADRTATSHAVAEAGLKRLSYAGRRVAGQ